MGKIRWMVLAITVDYDRLMDGAKADLVISDPPYNVVIDGHASGLGKVRHREFVMALGEMSSAEFTDFFRKAMTAARGDSATPLLPTTSSTGGA